MNKKQQQDLNVYLQIKYITELKTVKSWFRKEVKSGQVSCSILLSIFLLLQNPISLYSLRSATESLNIRQIIFLI
jgi:hypothetical protein